MELNRIIDHTLLKPESTKADIQRIVDEAKKFHFATVMVNPYWISFVKPQLEGTDVLAACVIGFPLGANTKAVKVFETEDALKNGADEVIYPGRDMAERVAKKYSANHVLDYVALNDNYSIYEINPPEGWVGKSIMENNVRQKYNVNIVTVKEAGKNRVLPLPDYVFKADDAVMVFGLNADVDKLVRKL